MRTTHVRLVDLQAGDGHRARRALASSMLNSPRKLSVPVRGPADLDEALDVAARGAREDALAEQVAGGVLAEVTRVAGEVEELAAVAEADLHLVDRGAAPDEQVLDAAAMELGADAGEGPVERGIHAQARLASDEGGGVLVRSPAPRRPRAWHRHPGASRWCPTRAAGAVSPGSGWVPSPSCSSRIDALAPAPSTTMVRPMLAGTPLAGARAQHDGVLELHPRGDVDDEAQGRDGAGHLGERVVRGQRRAILGWRRPGSRGAPGGRCQACR